VNSQVSDFVTTTDKARILCPVDFDVNSVAALDLARDLARRNDAMLYVLHVVPSCELAGATATKRRTPEFNEGAIAPIVTARSLVERTCHFYFAQLRFDELARQSLGDVTHRLLLRTGKPADQILDVANELKVRVVVMATNSRIGESRLCLGGVAENVIRECPCPLLTVRKASKSEQRRTASLIVPA
jgi:universal stress protein A